ncbi:lipase [Chryseobacterium shigense]|uniref:Acetyl esterase n=1 Tax=Chryseobacterium shigense TaxID=297244 RepID=A0A1N7HT07_9FLAO|nr:alpha/beta hydrolase [Chryseobacterium shigense]PQA93054.1 lipase [Chryseobacterium shigense]SIS27956.1 acetyl esterase [Chryseobacterium shigense]
MKRIIKNIDAELWEAISNSAFNQIDYESLLVNNPAKIREEEMNIIVKEGPLAIPKQLDVENIHIPSSDKFRKIRLRLYKAKGKQNLPVLLYFHGGAFIYGTPEQYDFLFFRLALDIDMMIVSVDYRLAPEHPFPAGMQDGFDALLWLSQHAEQIEGNKDNILIGGSSAGATMAASVTQLARDTKKAEIKHQYLLYPPMSHLLQTPSMNELAHAPMQTQKAAALMWKHYLQHTIIQPPKYAVPLLVENFHNLPNATIIVCEIDPLKDEAKIYARELEKAGILVNLCEIKGAVHAFDFFSCSLSNHFYTKQIELFNQILNPEQ